VSIQTRRWCGYFFAGALALQLVACAGKQEKKPLPEEEPGDGPPLSSIRASDVKDAQPADEPRAPYGNQSPYEVFGKKYYVLESNENYVQRGTASWYGTKFHGRRTSSGEPYDLHLATAAHKTLPLPTYAEVTNLDNGHKVIVKINDRGPFKDDRLIDMSYGAALRLDMIGTGTAPVEVRVIDTHGLQFAATEPDKVSETWLQIGAYGEQDGAEDIAQRLTKAKLKPVSIQHSNNVFRVWLGPYDSNNEINAVIEKAIELGFERPYKVNR
jgi:rare lipoprotein A